MKMLVNYELRFKQIAINAMGWFYNWITFFDCSFWEDTVFLSLTFSPDSYRWITKIITATSCIAGQFLWIDLCIEMIPIDKYLVVETRSVVFVVIETYLIFCCRNTNKSSASGLRHTPRSSHGDYIIPRIDRIAYLVQYLYLTIYLDYR